MFGRNRDARRRLGDRTGSVARRIRDRLGTLRPRPATSGGLAPSGMGPRLERRIPGARLGTAGRLGSPRRLGTAGRLGSPAWLAATPDVGRVVRRTTFRSLPSTALRIDEALGLSPGGQAQRACGDTC
jgi:hypothetical protein